MSVQKTRYEKYVSKYATCYRVTEEVAETHAMVREAKKYYGERDRQEEEENGRQREMAI